MLLLEPRRQLSVISIGVQIDHAALQPTDHENGLQTRLVQRALGAQTGKAAEIPVCREQRLHAVPQTQRGDACIMPRSALHCRPLEERAQCRPEAVPLVQQNEARRLQSVIDLDARIRRRRRRPINFRVRDGAVPRPT